MIAVGTNILIHARGVKTLWSADRDFSRMAGLHVVNPLLEKLVDSRENAH